VRASGRLAIPTATAVTPKRSSRLRNRTTHNMQRKPPRLRWRAWQEFRERGEILLQYQRHFPVNRKTTSLVCFSSPAAIASNHPTDRSTRHKAGSRLLNRSRADSTDSGSKRSCRQVMADYLRATAARLRPSGPVTSCVPPGGSASATAAAWAASSWDTKARLASRPPGRASLHPHRTSLETYPNRRRFVARYVGYRSPQGTAHSDSDREKRHTLNLQRRLGATNKRHAVRACPRSSFERVPVQSCAFSWFSRPRDHERGGHANERVTQHARLCEIAPDNLCSLQYRSLLWSANHQTQFIPSVRQQFSGTSRDASGSSGDQKALSTSLHTLSTGMCDSRMIA